MEHGEGKGVNQVVQTSFPTAAVPCATQAPAASHPSLLLCTCSILCPTESTELQWAQLIDLYLSDQYQSTGKISSACLNATIAKRLINWEGYVAHQSQASLSPRTNHGTFRLQLPAVSRRIRHHRVLDAHAPWRRHPSRSSRAPGSLWTDFMTAGRDPAKFPSPDSAELYWFYDP